MPGAPKIWLSQEQHDDFQRFARSHTLPARLVERARIILGAAQGRNTERIATQLGIARQTVARWRLRFAERGTPTPRRPNWRHFPTAAPPHKRRADASALLPTDWGYDDRTSARNAASEAACG